jgi:lipopolysaccharide transport system ATP-binding protein
VVGIIGRNGAGKSTLLKILSRITEPTEGRVTLRGRVASLLEVGTGFHPELTGRENIFLNGAILGMTKAEIKKKFDEIVAFAEVERFLDTPVKRYSSGMYVRLAFAVAAHLEPEILVVDEVLAVGDAEFQKKCLGKMKDVAAGGRTVLFVSHNLSAVKALCGIGLELQKGKVRCVGEIGKVIDSYKQSAQNTLVIIPDTSKEIYITEVRTESMHEKTAKVVAGENLKVVIKYKKGIKNISADFCFTIFSSMDVAVAHLKTSISGAIIKIKQDEGSVECDISMNPLNIGHYRIATAIMSNSGEILDLVSSSCSFEVIASNIYKSGKYPDPKYSIIQLEGIWCHE